MKAYQFYKLLGKYKKGTMSEVEFVKFARTIERHRSLRHAFYESTGEYHPKLREKRSSSPTDNQSTVKDSQVQIEKSVARFKKVRRKKVHWIKQFFTDLRANSTVIIACLVLLIIFAFLLTKNLSKEEQSHEKTLVELAPQEIHSGTRTFQIEGSISDGLILSEADLLLAVQMPTIETQILDVKDVQPQAIGLEDAIIKGLNEMFVDPEAALSEMERPPSEKTAD